MKSWDNIWDDIFKNQSWGKYPGESLIQFTARNFYQGNRQQTKLLEVGCGPGANIWYLSREQFNVYGIDGSKAAIEIAKQRLSLENLKATLIIGDIINLPFETNYFDGIIDVECIYCNNWENTEIILQEIQRTLKTKGLFYSRTFAEDMFVGDAKCVEKNEYNDIPEGPLKGKGFVRLSNEESIRNLYGKYFNILSIDKLKYTINNGKNTISEYIIICRK